VQWLGDKPHLKGRDLSWPEATTDDANKEEKVYFIFYVFAV
jgi:hypothetical protein